MSADHEEIRYLLATYSFCVDNREFERLGELLADAVFRLTWTAEGIETGEIRGREEIERFYAEHLAGRRPSRHVITNVAIDLDEGRINSDPLKGLIINRTVTVMGWDFYSNFTQVWQALYPDSQDTMTVIERPTAQFGSEIWISYLDQTVFHTFLSPARSRAKDQSREVVQAVRENIDIINAQRKFIQNADLGPEEM